MIANKLSQLASDAAARYETLTLTWEALFGRALSAPDFGRAGQGTDIVNEAYAVAGVFVAQENDLIARHLEEIASEAHQSVREGIASIDADELSEAALEHLSETESYLQAELVAQIHRDIALVRQSLQHAALSVSTMSRTRRIPRRQAQMEYRLDHPMPIDFRFTDRRSRRISSKIFIASVWRQALLSAHNEVTLMTIADHGLERAAIMKVEAGVELQTGSISLTGVDDLPTYDEIRLTHFHPNSNAYLAMEPAHV